MSARELGKRVAAQVTRLNENSTYAEQSSFGSVYLESAVETLAVWASRYTNDDAKALHDVAYALTAVIESGPLALASGTPDNPTPVEATNSRVHSEGW